MIFFACHHAFFIDSLLIGEHVVNNLTQSLMKKGLNAFSKLYTRHRKKKKTLTSLENPFFKTKRKKKILVQI